MVVGIAAVTFTGFILMLVILKFGRNSKFGIKGKHLSARPKPHYGLELWKDVLFCENLKKRNAKGRLCFNSNELY